MNSNGNVESLKIKCDLNLLEFRLIPKIKIKIQTRELGMILRTPLPQKKRSRLESTSDQTQSIHGCITSPVSDRRLVLYNDPSSSDQLEQSDMVCTYHCRQMVNYIPTLMWAYVLMLDFHMLACFLLLSCQFLPKVLYYFAIFWKSVPF